MKKSLIALSLIAAAGTANAAEIYSMDGALLTISGEVEVQFLKSQTPDSDLEVQTETSTLTADFSYELNEEILAGASYELDGSGEVSEVYVYATKEASTLSVGKTSTIFDDAGIGDDYAFGFSSFVDTLTTSGDQVVKYRYDNGNVFYGGIAYGMNKSDVEGDYLVDGNLGARLGDMNYTLFAAQSETGSLTENNYALEARYVYGNMTYAATYGYTNSEQTTGSDTEIDIVGLALTWDDGGLFSYAAGWANVDNSANTDRVNDVYANITYYLADSVSTYAEIGLTDDDSQDTGFVLGMDVTF